ncbi:unnamed protein product [Clonostachys rosea]|uniref:Ion transport domain-containing protein n=1 Tax=Bionectria ochroleuca TaxID=29856 RepID=A0ABY6TYU6_BIOOC|nr:unnamed protein product [Clonostachys rosea]
MISSFLRRPRQARRRVGGIGDSHLGPRDSPSPASYRKRATADFTEADDDDEDEDDDHEDPNLRNARFDDRDDGDGHDDADEGDEGDEDDGEGDEDGRRAALPVLPLFSATHLDSLPVYSITHAIRIIVTARTETTLTWEQLRSPQISQFLVKPMQRQIRAQHFSRATLYALMANCLQFNKEGQLYAANAGTSYTRAKVCELLALKMLKEYSTRELIDALAYDFYPLQGIPGISAQNIMPKPGAKNALTASRTSTLEVAIRASAKHFLAHPVVVQQLEAIWSGAITFYSSADSLHRESPQGSFPSSTESSTAKPDSRTPLLGSPPKIETHPHVPPGRRTVMLYDPRQASMLKLSRLRVPRYRSFLSTLSLAILIGLFLAVLSERSSRITGLELVFWFWSAGFMLDELVGFNEQGFALYIMSFWNLFDLGILVLLIVYYCMRAYGVFMVDPHHWNDMAYDVLAANAILLLPRIFSVLDHYQYFSQLLIAFRLMAVDLVAVFTLVLILCSGFYVFFTLSKNNDDGGEVAYKIFQILMGFTPAAWDVWPTYNWLGRMLMVLFLIICHFLVVTILITVLTNSFMAIASNATEEHQFLFAINTISMVKNDALFSYIAPSNIFAWLLMPLRYCMPLRQFVWLNRTIIKVTHFPVLFLIYLYERFWLAPSMFEPTDLIEHPGRARDRTVSFIDPGLRTAMFSPNVRVREESVSGFQKDRALEEVFRRVPASATVRSQRRNERRKTQTAIRNWMDQHVEDDGSATKWPTLDSRAFPEWQRRMSVGWERPSNLRHVSDIRSIASDPADLMSNLGGPNLPRSISRRNLVPLVPEYKDHTDADGDDELVTNDEDEDDNATNDISSRKDRYEDGGEEEDYFMTPMTSRIAKLPSSHSSSGGVPPTPRPMSQRRGGLHSRTLSTNTILYNPEEPKSQSSSSASQHALKSPVSSRPSGRSMGGHQTPGRRSSPRRSSPRRASPKRVPGPANPKRPTLPPRGITETGGVSRSALMSIEPQHRPRVGRRLSSVDLSVLSDNMSLHFAPEDHHVGMPGSFQTQMAMAMMKDKRMRAAAGGDSTDRDRMGRLVLARMKTLEESFAEMIKEMRDMKQSSGIITRLNSSTEGATSDGPANESRYGPPKRRRGDATPKKSSGASRPISRRSMKEPKVGLQPLSTRNKGKGKAPAYSSESEAEEYGGFTRRGSSF